MLQNVTRCSKMSHDTGIWLSCQIYSTYNLRYLASSYFEPAKPPIPVSPKAPQPLLQAPCWSTFQQQSLLAVAFEAVPRALASNSDHLQPRKTQMTAGIESIYIYNYIYIYQSYIILLYHVYTLHTVWHCLCVYVTMTSVSIWCVGRYIFIYVVKLKVDIRL